MALEQGTPSVCTTIAVEGFTEQGADWHVFDEPAAFAKEAARLYTNKIEWNQKQGLGFNTLVRGFSYKNYTTALSKTLQSLKDQLEKHRSRNFVGAMLHHHSMQSTKYLSKWITLKNELKTREQ